jgi:L-fuconolactonase
MRITDAHIHFWTPATFAYQMNKEPPQTGDPDAVKTTWNFLPPAMVQVLNNTWGPQELKPLLDEVGVDQVVLLQTYHTYEHNQDFLAAAAANDWVGGVVCWADLTDKNLGRVLDEHQKHPKFKGVRHIWHDEKDPGWNARPNVLAGLKELERRGIPYDLLVKAPNWPYMRVIAEALPDLPLVIDHIAKPRIDEHQFDDWAAVMDEIARCPNVMCKLSGLTTEAKWHEWKTSEFQPYVDKVVEAFGPDRTMYGGDWPPSLLAADSYKQVFEAIMECLKNVSETDQAKIMGETARRFYKLD